MTLWIRAWVLGLALLVAASGAWADSVRDPRLDQALALADQGDWQGARDLAADAAKAASMPEQAFEVHEVQATIAHWQGEDAEAVALLDPVLAEGATLFGPDSPRLIADLRMLAISQANLGEDAASIRTQIRALRLAREAFAKTGGEDDLQALLLTLGDLARSDIDAGQNASAALLAAEGEMQTYDDAGDRPEAQEAHMLRALAHLRMGHWVEAALHALPVERLSKADRTPDAAELLDLFQTEAAEAAGKDAKTVLKQWHAEALVREQERDADLQVMNEAMAPVMQALQNQDIVAADSAARTALQNVRADDPLVIGAYLALMTGTLAARHPELAVAWAVRLAEEPVDYLSSLQIDLGDPFTEVANWLILKDRPAEAVPFGRVMAEMARLRFGDDSDERLFGLNLQGEAARRAGLWDEAGGALKAAVALEGTAPVAGRRAKIKVQTLVQSGLLAEDQGQTDAAETAYTEALDILQTTDAGSDTKGWSYVLGQLGALYTSMGRLDAAEALLQQSLALTEKTEGEASHNTALALYELARLQIYAGDLGKAQVTLDRALEAGRKSMAADDSQLATMYLMESQLLDQTGHPDQARQMMAQALAGGQTGADAASKAGFLMHAAVLATNDGSAAKGRSLMDQALGSTPEEDPIYAHLEAAAGAMALKDNDLPAALALFRKATAALTQADRRSEPDARDHLPLHVDTARRLSDAATGTNALSLMGEAFAVAQRVNDISAGAALNKAAARLQGGSAALSDLARDLEAREASIGSTRAALLASLAKGQAGTAERAAFDAANAGYVTAQAAIAAQFPRYAAYADPKPQDLLATMKLLGPDEVLVLFATSDMTGFNFADSSTVIALTREGYVSAGLPPRAEVQTLARALRCAAARTDRQCGTGAGKTRGAFSLEEPADDAGPGFDLALAYKAYQTLLEPVSDAFKGKTTLIVVPDKALAAMPFHLMLTAAPDAQTGLRDAPWLIRKMAVMVVPTVASLASLRGPQAHPSRATKPFLGIGDPVLGAGSVPYDCGNAPDAGLLVASLVPYDQPLLRNGDLANGLALASLPALPETACELQAIARDLGAPGAVLLQGDATEGRVKALSSAGDLLAYRVLSFATHGLIAGELGANNAGLVLTPPKKPDAEDDGLLTTAEIANLRLDADFVLLSACNTAAGATQSDEGLSGLASAFFLAGARSLLVSHWPVYSDAATRLTTATFAALTASPGIGRAEALRRAMLSVLDDPDASAAMLDPGWWGPFMIAGEGGAGR